MVLTPSLFSKDPFMRLKRKRLRPTIGLKDVRREQVETRATRAEEGGGVYPSSPCIEKGEKDICSSEEEAGSTRLLVCSKEGKGTLH